MIRKITFIFLLSLTSVNRGNSQSIVHIENNRLAGKNEDFSGSADFNLVFIQNVNDVFQSGFNSQLQYTKKKHNILSLTAQHLTIFNGSKVLNDGLQHIRYGYKFTKRITGEVFTQAQYNVIIKIKERYLNGIGPRFTLINSDSLKMFVGTLYMYEHENETTGVKNTHHRISSYLSLGWQANKNIHLDLIGYYQPDISNNKDFRVSTELSTDIKITQRLSYKISLAWFYDSQPPDGIRSIFYTFRNGLKLTF